MTDDVERCEKCGTPLPAGSARVLEDELLCARCYEKKVGSWRWFSVTIAADGALLLAAIVAFVIVQRLPLPNLPLKAALFAFSLVAIAFLRPHLQSVAKDLLMKKKRNL